MAPAQPDNMKITLSDGTGWDEYVVRHPGSFFYHLYGWGRAIEEVFGFKKLYLEAQDGAVIRGVLPLVLVETILGRKLVSIPIGVYAGAIADDEPTAGALIKRAIALSQEHGCDYLELRNMARAGDDLPSKELYVTFIKPLPVRAEECLERIPRKARAEIRHAIDKGLTYETGLRYLEECYRIYAINQRYLGSPVVSKKWFVKLAEVFKDTTDILVVKAGGRCIAAVLTFFCKDTVLPFYGGVLPGCERYSPSNFMYLKLQEYGVAKGCKYFDFGRSRKGAGSYHFKMHQGFEPIQLYYQYYLNKAKAIPDISPSNKGFDAAKYVWRHLPLPLTNALGPAIFKYVMP